MVLYSISTSHERKERKSAYLVTFVDQLMSTSDQLQAVDLVKLGRNLVSEQPSCTTWRHCPGVDLFRIGPHEITEGSLMRNFLCTSDDTNLIQSADLWRQTTVNTENCSIYDSSKNEEVENLATCLPDRRVTIFLLALLVETIYLGNLAGLVVSTNQGDAIRISKIISFLLLTAERAQLTSPSNTSIMSGSQVRNIHDQQNLPKTQSSAFQFQ